ncbi:MAG: CoA ester lyase [Bradyrhizobium sp.]|nr:CoA ester lyase [Bradyrhizobium sp.]
MIPRWRSLLFVAADDHKRVTGIAERGADAVILDLEDAVPLGRKASARATLPDTALAVAATATHVVVRINTSWRDAVSDLDMAVCDGVAAIMVPKVEDAARLAVIAEMVAELTIARELPRAPGIIALVESPAGLAELDRIAATPGLIGLALGSEDFSLSLGVPPTPEALDLPCRMVALAAARHCLMALGVPVSIATFDDDVAWRDAVARGKAIGLTGALCIHPRQVGPANNGFSPSVAEIEIARRALAAWNEAGARGVIRFEGRMVDEPVAQAARRTLATARAALGGAERAPDVL